MIRTFSTAVRRSAVRVRRTTAPASFRRTGVATALAVLALAACSNNANGNANNSAGTPTSPTAATNSAPSGAAAKGLPPCVSPQPATNTVDRGLPDVTLDCLVDGQQVKLSDLRGKPLLVNVWAQWCGPCRKEAPFLQELAKRANGRIALLGVDIADPRPDLAIAFASEHGWTYPHLRDPDKLLQEPLNLIGPPATAFVTAEGELKYIHLGPFTSFDQLAKQVHDTLGVTL